MCHVLLADSASILCLMQGSEGPHLVANVAFLAEKTAKESAAGKLTTLRRTVAHKDELLKTVKTKAGLLLIPSQIPIYLRILLMHAK